MPSVPTPKTFAKCPVPEHPYQKPRRRPVIEKRPLSKERGFVTKHLGRIHMLATEGTNASVIVRHTTPTATRRPYPICARSLSLLKREEFLLSGLRKSLVALVVAATSMLCCWSISLLSTGMPTVLIYNLNSHISFFLVTGGDVWLSTNATNHLSHR